MTDKDNSKYIIMYKQLYNWTYTLNQNYGTITFDTPLASIEAIDEKVSSMEIFPEVTNILEKIK